MSNSKRFIASFAGVAAGAVMFLLATALVTDPRGIVAPAFEGLPQLCAGGSSLESREVKPFLALAHRPREILVGNSRVQNGFGADDARERLRQPAVNLGLSGARLDELAALVRHAWTVAPVERVWLGIDYPMFALPARGELGIPSATDRRLQALRYGVADPAAIRSAVEYLAGSEACRRPTWTRLGFVLPQSTSPTRRQAYHRRRAAFLTQRQIDQGALRPAAERARIRQERHRLLRQLIREARARDVRLVLFIAPTSPEFGERLARAGLFEDHEAWRHEVAALAAAERHAGLVFLDISTDPVVAEAARRRRCTEDAAPGCPFHDITHYRPAIGRRILDLGTAGDHGRGPGVRTQYRRRS